MALDNSDNEVGDSDNDVSMEGVEEGENVEDIGSPSPSKKARITPKGTKSPARKVKTAGLKVNVMFLQIFTY